MSAKFSERLRAARETKGWSQTELAEHSGLQPSAISHFETNRRSPSFENLKRLADALSVSIDFLLDRDDELKGSGPVVQKLFRDFSRLSAADQENLAKFADILAQKNKERSRGG